MARRLGLAQALINDPEFLILDEPTSGLDPVGTRQVKDLLLDLRRRGKTILLSSHLLADVEDVCTRMVILYGGKVRAEGTVDQLLDDSDHTLIRTRRLTPATVSRVEKVLQETEGVSIESVQRRGRSSRTSSCRSWRGPVGNRWPPAEPSTAAAPPSSS